MRNNAIEIRTFCKETKLLLFNFLILALVGTLLRYLQTHALYNISYKNLLEAHSHFAFSGVLLLSCLTALRTSFSTINNSVSPKLFYVFLIESYMLLVVFVIYGYKAPGIVASMIYLFTTYYFACRVWLGIKKMENRDTALFLQYAIFFMFFSSLALWCMGPLMALKFAGKPIYYNTVYFYLHFQYNGFFTFCVFALFCNKLSIENAFDDKRILRRNIHLFALATLLSYFISVLWCKPAFIIHCIAFAGALLQIFVFVSTVLQVRKSAHNKNSTFDIKSVIFIFFCIKFLMMFVITLPVFNFDIFANRHVIIGFLHLTFIGTIWLSYWYFIQREILNNTFDKINNMLLFFVFFLIYELLLFSSVINIPLFTSRWNNLLLACSIGMTAGIFSMLISAVKNKSACLS